MPLKKTCKAVTVLFLTISYVMICDRSALFRKSAKDWDPLLFGSSMLLLTIFGFATLKQNENNNSSFLNREQTDEWKGWMQVIILIYHFTGASSVTGIYNRKTKSEQLIFWKKEIFSRRRRGRRSISILL